MDMLLGVDGWKVGNTEYGFGLGWRLVSLRRRQGGNDVFLGVCTMKFPSFQLLTEAGRRS